MKRIIAHKTGSFFHVEGCRLTNESYKKVSEKEIIGRKLLPCTCTNIYLTSNDRDYIARLALCESDEEIEAFIVMMRLRTHQANHMCIMSSRTIDN